MSDSNSVTLPSIRALTLDSEAFGAVHAPVLVIHGRRIAARHMVGDGSGR